MKNNLPDNQQEEQENICWKCKKVKWICKCWRPAKINRLWIDTAIELTSNEMNIIALTDMEYLETVNEKVEDKLKEQNKYVSKKEIRKHQISDGTFMEYKAGKELSNPVAQAMLDEFSEVYKKAIKIQKKNLMIAMAKEDKSRQRFAWIIERKFGDWNLKKVSEKKIEHSGNINIGSIIDDVIE